MASRSYSPFAPRSYAPRSRNSSPLSSFSFLTSDKTKHFRITLWVVAAALLVLSVLFSYAMYLFNNLSSDQIKSQYPKMASTIVWVGTTGGKVFLAALWVMFALTVLPIGAGEWFRSQQKRIL